jgi:pyridoxal biosynthesis lyase PdxS
VICAGGIANGRGLLAMLALGADGVAMGSRLATTIESPLHDNVKKAIVEHDENDTIFQEYILSDNISETYDQNHENIDQLLNEDVLNITSNILPKSMNINLQDKEQTCDVVTKEIEELNNQQ